MTHEEHLEKVLAQISAHRAEPEEPGPMPLLERMRAQLFVWEDNEPDEEKWTSVQREYAEAFMELGVADAMYRELAKRPVPELEGDPF